MGRRLSGKNALVVAPTGSGKTLSAFLWSIDRLFADPPETARTRVLYISPLKALGVDIERNLRSPLVGIGHTVRRLNGERGITDDAGSLWSPRRSPWACAPGTPAPRSDGTWSAGPRTSSSPPRSPST